VSFADPLDVAVQRVQAARLIPPVTTMQIDGGRDGAPERVLVLVTAPTDPAVLAQLNELLADMPHEVREVPPGYGQLISGVGPHS
jgi:hypothetical protein